MKHMKKRLIALLALSMLFTLAACGEEDPVTQPDEAPVDAVKAQRQKQKQTQEQEQDTVFDFGAYAVEFKNAELLEGDYGYDCLMLTLAYANIDPEETGRLGENIQCTAIQSGEELFPGGLHEYSENEPSYVTDGQIVDFHIGFHLQLEYNQVYYDMSEIEVVLQDKNSDLAYSFTVDPSVLDDSGLKTGGGKGTGETEGFGDFKSVLVPANFELRLDSWKENNPHFVSIASRDWIYFNFRNYTYEEDLRNEYEYLKKNYTEGQIDVSANYGGIDWTGFQYDDGSGGYGFYAYTVIGDNHLLLSSAGFTFDDETTQAVLGSVVMSDGSDATDSVDMTGADRTDTEVGGAYPGGLDWLHYWTGNWYGWWMMTDGTGLYAEWNDGTGEGVWDACAYIEGHECLDGTMELWDSGGSWDDPIACIDLTFANPDDTPYGVMCCYGGQFLSSTLERDAWYINPDEFIYENLIDFDGDYEDEDGTFSYRVMLRPWGTVWDDMSEGLYPEQYYYDWYLPLVEAGEDMPDHIG